MFIDPLFELAVDFLADSLLLQRRAKYVDQTLAALWPALPRFGITRVANVTGLDVIGIPTVMVVRPNARSLSVAQGKGVTLAAAQVSGIMESIEFWHAENYAGPLIHGSYLDLESHYRLVDVRLLPHKADSNFVFGKRIFWCEGQLWGRGDSIWVPHEAVHMDYTLPRPPAEGGFLSSSNGLASGTCINDAILHALCELVERDALTLWELMSAPAQQATRIQLSSVQDAACRWLIERFEQANVLCAVWEITSDVGIPAFLCRILHDVPPPYTGCRPAFGVGCHPNPVVALSRALTEAAQSRLTFIAGARDDLSRAAYRHYQQPEIYLRWRQTICDHSAIRQFDHRAALPTELGAILDRLQAVGLDQVIVVNLAHPFGTASDISVVKLLVPGLEGKMDSDDYVPGPRALAQFHRYQEAE